MTRSSVFFLAAGLALCSLPGGRLLAGGRESATVASAAEVLQALSAVPFQGIPRTLLQDAQGIAIIPDVLKAGFVIGGRRGHGVVLVRGPGGVWSNPVFLTLTGGGIGWQIGIQSTDLVLVFKTRPGLDRILQGKGKLTLGADVAVAAGPVGRQVEAGTDGRLQAEIYSYSRSRGLFAGVSVEGAGLRVDTDANDSFYGIRGGRAINGQAPNLPVPAVAQQLRAVVTDLTAPPPPLPPAVPYPPRLTPAPVSPAAYPPAGEPPMAVPPPPYPR